MLVMCLAVVVIVIKELHYKANLWSWGQVRMLV